MLLYFHNNLNWNNKKKYLLRLCHLALKIMINHKIYKQDYGV